jgi:hypothetical protein
MSLTTITRTPPPPLPSTGVNYVVRHRARGMDAEPKPQMIVHHLPTELFSTRNEASNRVRQGNRDTMAGRCEIILQRLLLLLVCIRDEAFVERFQIRQPRELPDAAIIILHLHPFPRWARCEMSHCSVPTLRAGCREGWCCGSYRRRQPLVAESPPVCVVTRSECGGNSVQSGRKTEWHVPYGCTSERNHNHHVSLACTCYPPLTWNDEPLSLYYGRSIRLLSPSWSLGVGR